MPKPTLLVTRRLPPDVEARAAREFDARLNSDDTPRTGAEIARLAAGADAVLCCSVDRMDEATIAALPPSVKVLGTYSVGFEHIDIAAAAARGLPVLNTPDVLSVATAEFAMLLILAASRRAGTGERLVRSGKWPGWTPTQLIGTQVSGRRLGIFGMGRIGRELARMAGAFQMEIHYHNSRRLPPELEHGAIFHPSDASFLPMCDVLSLHAPGGQATRHWLNADRIARLPRGAVVVNTARGTLIDDSALIAALRAGHVAHAGLDVYEGEPQLNPGYLELENVFLTAHQGSGTLQTRAAMGDIMLDGILSVLAGQQPKNLIG